MVKPLSSLVIRFEDVVKVVNYLREMTSTIDADSPLLYLNIVEENINRANRVLSDRLRVDALTDLICELITEAYEAQLYHLNTTHPEIYTRKQALKIIASYRQTSVRLIGLSLLYFCHVRAEFDIGYDLFGDTVAMSPRNLRRIKRGSVGFIQQLLTKREEQTRSRLQMHLLRRALPHMGSNVLFGRDEALNIGLCILTQEDSNLILHGDRGCGKSVFAEQLAFQYIQQESVDAVLWLNGEDEITEACIRHELGIDHQSTIEQATAHHDILVVIDDYRGGMEDIMRLMPHARYIFICNSLDFILNDMSYLHLSPLDDANIERVGRLYANKYIGGGYDIGDDFLAYMVKQAAGNPQAIKTMLKAYFETSPADQTPQHDVDLALLCLSFTREHFIEQGKLKYFWGELIPESVWPHLTHHTEDIVFEQKRFIKLRAGETARLRARAGGFIPDAVHHQISDGLLIQPETGLYVVHAILKERGKFDPAWLRILIELEATLSHHVLWFDCLQAIYQQRRLFNNDRYLSSRLCIALSACYRHNGQPEQGLNMLDDHDTFEALIERVQCYRYMGAYEAAFDAMASIEINAPSPSRQQRDAFLLLYAQMLIDIQDGGRAVECLNACSPEAQQSTLFELMRTEAHNLMADGETTLPSGDVFHHRMASPEDTQINLHLNFMRDRMAYQTDADSAARHFLIALQIAQNQPRENRIIIGRCLSNIGACYIKQKQPFMARRYLQRAEEIQIRSEDKLGLLYTSRNLELLDKYAG